MKIKSVSSFKEPVKDLQYYEDWIKKLESLNQCSYQKLEIKTSLGKTSVWGINVDNTKLPPLLVFPGFRTSTLFWDLDRALDDLRNDYRIFLIETNGQPNLSDGHTPPIRSTGYGIWALEVINQLGLEKVSIAGASFGSLVCLKLSIVAPEKIDKIILLNPGCLQLFSPAFKNVWYNLLPIVSPSEKNVRAFLENTIFCKPNHQLSKEAEQLLIEYEIFVLKRFIDKAQKPYPMRSEELRKIQNDTYLLLGDHDTLFPYKKSISIAQKHLHALKKIYVLKNTGHGIETSKEAISIMKNILSNTP